MREQIEYMCEEARKMVERWIEWDRERGGCGAKDLIEHFEFMILPSLTNLRANIWLDLTGEEGLEWIGIINRTIGGIYAILNDYMEECYER
jgi:hypothetical protein